MKGGFMEVEDMKSISTRIKCVSCGSDMVMVILLPSDEPKVSNITNVISQRSNTKIHRTSRKSTGPKKAPPSGSLGIQVRRLRDQMGWSIYELSSRSGVSPIAIKAIEGDVRKYIHTKTLSKLAKALNVLPEGLKDSKIRVVPPGASGRPEGR
jgi:ribosome-binding protein aMBF1 (putative translation factor)